MPNKFTLTRLPDESKVETNKGMPKSWSVTVSVPSAMTVNIPPSKLLNKASSGGVLGGGGDSDGDGGVGGGGAGELTATGRPYKLDQGQRSVELAVLSGSTKG